jgi:hypothetical protein
VGRRGPGPGGPRPLGPPGPVDPLLLEGPLQGPGRGDGRGGATPEQLNAHPSAAPVRVLSLEPTGAAEDAGVGPRRGSAAGLIADDQAFVAVVAEGPPQVADGGVGEMELGRDPEQGLAFQVPADDLLAKGVGDGAGHEESSGVHAKTSRDFIPAPNSGVKLSVRTGG